MGAYMENLTTTTIGSLFSLSPNIHEAIDKAINLQKQYRLDILTDGEQRADMISYFAESLEGLGFENRRAVVLGKIKLKNEAEIFSKIQDLEHIKEKYPDIKIKIAITGPTTLGIIRSRIT